MVLVDFNRLDVPTKIKFLYILKSYGTSVKDKSKLNCECQQATEVQQVFAEKKQNKKTLVWLGARKEKTQPTLLCNGQADSRDCMPEK